MVDVESATCDGPKGWKDQAAKWLFSQGASTVLLFSILVSLGYGIPWWENKHQAERKEMREDNKAIQEKFNEDVKETRSEYLQSLREITRSSK